MDLIEIFRSDKVFEFWPTARQSEREKFFAVGRFIIYATTLIYLITRDPRIFSLGLVVFALLYYFTRVQVPSSGSKFEVQRPSSDNPMGNKLLYDDDETPWYPSVRHEVDSEWRKIHPFENKADAERNFYSVPLNDQNAFVQAAYGSKQEPMCKSHGGRSCDIDNSQYHFPERVHMIAGNGR
jgi:hypothetical protein